ncbi:MAG: DUF433 domain-containing protein [Bacteroidetes bacterium]|nr:DUF433 domain-containing protein [Bacteroidota bacterium]
MQESIIVRDPKVMLGKPIIKGTRITVELVIRKIADGFSIQDILEAYPHLNREQVAAALDFAARMIADEVMSEA